MINYTTHILLSEEAWQPEQAALLKACSIYKSKNTFEEKWKPWTNIIHLIFECPPAVWEISGFFHYACTSGFVPPVAHARLNMCTATTFQIKVVVTEMKICTCRIRSPCFIRPSLAAILFDSTWKQNYIDIRLYSAWDTLSFKIL